MANDNDNVSEEVEEIEQSFLDRFLNILICRGDLAKERLEAQPVSFIELFRYASRRDKLYILFGAILAVLVGTLQPLTCVLSGLMANHFLQSETIIGSDKFLVDSLHILLGFIVIGVSLLIISFLQTYFLYNGCMSIVNGIRERFVEAVLRQDAEWFDHRDAGMITSQLNNNIERIQDGIGDKIGLILRGVFNFVAGVVYCLYFNWRTTLVMIGVGPVGAITMGIMARVAAKPTNEMLENASEASAIAEEAIMNVKTIAACNGQQHMVKKFSQILKNGEKSAIRMYFWNGFFEGFMFFELYLFYAIGFIESIINYYHGVTTNPGSVFIVVNTMMMGSYFLGLLGPHMMTILKSRVAASVIYKTIERIPPNMEKKEEGGDIAGISGEIEFKDVQFTYPTRTQPILRGLNWKAEKGETVALVGHSGCGKSTSIGLITRLYDADQGTIILDGKDISNFHPTSLRKVVGIVQQEPCLFNGSIRENICLGRKNIDEKKMEEATKTSNAHDFIMKLENGYDTVIGTGGVSLSGGQKQRIAIARAIVTDPKILLLDEATSALDTESEKIVQIALKNASIGRTTIVIAHRLSTLRDVNKIFVLDKGVVEEIGTHYELISKGGLYSTLAKAQEVEQNVTTKYEPEPTVIRKTSLYSSSTRFGFRASGIEQHSIATTIGYQMGGEDIKIDEKTGEKEKLTFPLFSYLRSAKSNALVTILAFLCAALRGLELPFLAVNMLLTYSVFESTSESYSGPLIQTCVFAICLGLWCWFFICAASLFSGWAGEAVTNNLKTCILSKLLNQDAAYFDKPGNSNAACVASLSLNAPNAMAALDPRMVLLVNNFIALITCIIIVLAFNLYAGAACVALMLIMLMLQSYLTYKLQIINGSMEREDNTAEMAIEIFEQARTIQLLTVEDYFIGKYLKSQGNISKMHHTKSLWQATSYSLLISYLYFSDFTTFGLGVSLMYRGMATSKEIFITAMAANMGGWAILFLSPSTVELVRASNSCRALFRFMEAHCSYGSGGQGKSTDLSGNVNVEKVHFSYPARPAVKVANNLNLRASRGEAIALVGASGCGKSTVISLLERFYTAQSGKCKVDDSNIVDINIAHLRNNIALVGQEPVLFRGSIYENVTLGVDNVSMDDVVKACRTANAATFIENFPLGYETDVGEKGRNLSGGQKQRIAIARALVRNPKIILLDEATSALDTESERIVQEALNEASAGRTSITIAHRLSTIQNADRIYFIENGGVVEYGTHQELLECDGKYATLVKAQCLMDPSNE